MSRRLYRLLLRGYPRSFRERFGADMVETFVSDLVQARRRGALAVGVRWLRAIGSHFLRLELSVTELARALDLDGS